MYKLKQKERELITDKIKSFFLDERDEEIGDLAAELFLDFIREEIAQVFYNKGVQAAKQKVEENFARISDDIACLEQLVEK